ncbi:18374_t:CDS:2 [Rhizophagus irregularis]|nr:18374_t:CDS:2 [Rhizophagus irregularis]
MEKILKVTELSDISMYQHKKDLDNDNAASLVDKVVIAEEKVVDVIKKHRMGVEEELDEDMVTKMEQIQYEKFKSPSMIWNQSMRIFERWRRYGVV